MASVKFQDRGRKGRIPLSLYAPLRVSDEKPLFKVLSGDAVPQGYPGVKKDEQIGYWNEQPRWRVRRGEKVTLPSNWHFYYLGTGPHADLPFRKRTPGVYWVALNGAKTSPTDLPTRKATEKPIEPDFKSNLPNNVEVVEPTTPPASRSNSRSQSRGPQPRDNSSSRSNSQSRNKNQPRNNSSGRQNQNQSRNQSRNRSQSNDRSSPRDDMIDMLKEALKSMGFEPNQSQKGQDNAQSGRKTPKNKSRSSSKQRTSDDKPDWRKSPTSDVEAVFGPRGGFQNFGDFEMLQKGVNASGYAQVASLTPSPAALLFGGNVSVRQLADEVEITYTYKMTVPKDNPNLALFLEQVDAFKNGAPKEQRVKRQRRSKSPALAQSTQTDNADEQSEPIYDNVPDDLPEGTQVEIINEVYDDASSTSTA